jgi:hypothetical protein
METIGKSTKDAAVLTQCGVYADMFLSFIIIIKTCIFTYACIVCILYKLPAESPSRPKALEHICLADFTSKYRRMKGKGNNEAEYFEGEKEEIEVTNEHYKLKGGYVLKRRKKDATLRYVRYHIDMDRENHFREIVMLFQPWSEEEMIIGDSESYEEHFQQIVDRESDVTQKMEEYNHHSEELQKALKELEEKTESDLEDGWDRAAPNAQHQQRMAEEGGSRPSDIYPGFLPPVRIASGDGVDAELGGGGGSAIDINVKIMKDDDYLSLLRSLNKKQQEIFAHVLHKVKLDQGPFHLFITGGAGVGKSVVITALHQALIRYLNNGPENNPDDARSYLAHRLG